MIDFLIRVHNESIWLPQLLRSLESQEGDYVRNILILDNNSEDNPKEIINQYPNLKIIYSEYKKYYLPGEMLNYGLDILMKMNTKNNYINDDYVCIVSAHCFFDDNCSLLKFFNHLKNISNCRSGYGRQVPMNISDAQAIRDLVLLYPMESRIIKKAPAFNNAYSLIRYDALKENSFSNETTNLEDVIWADNELQKGYKIAYCAESEIVHFHGPHHSNSYSRLEKTKKTIKNNSKVFNINLRKANIVKKEIISIFAGYDLKDDLIIEAKKQILNRKIILWTSKNYKNFFNKKQLENIIWIERNKLEDSDTAIYDNFNYLSNQISQISNQYNFYVLYDNSIDTKLPLITPESAVKIIRENFGNVIWPSIYSKKIIFTSDEKGQYYSNQRFIENKWIKNDEIEVFRGNGTILSRGALKKPKLMFDNPSFYFLNNDKY